MVEICALPECPEAVKKSSDRFCCRLHRQLDYVRRRRRQTNPAAVSFSDVVTEGGAVSVPAEAATRIPGCYARDSGPEIAIHEKRSLSLGHVVDCNPIEDEIDGAYVEPDRPRPDPVAAVAYRGRMVLRDGERHATWRPENHQWRDWLCDRDQDSRLVGKDPMTIPLEILTASGHPYPRDAGVANVVSRLKVMQGVDGNREGADMGLPFPEPTRYTNVRDYCFECSSGSWTEVRRCALYDCPAWAYRMGHNPHHPQRGRNKGINPFAGN